MPRRGPPQTPKNTIEQNRKISDRQTIAVTDLLSEGPIYGLIDGQASVFLNDDRAAPLGQAGASRSRTALRITLTNGSTSATITNGGSNPLVVSSNGKKYLTIRGGSGTQTVVASNSAAGTDNGAIVTTLTTTGGASFFTNAMVSAPGATPETHVPFRLTRTSALHGVTDEGAGEGVLTTRTSATVGEFTAGSGAPGGIWVPEGTYTAEVDKVVEVASVSGVTVTLASAWGGTTGSYKFDVSGTIVTDSDVVSQTQISSYEGVTTQFRVGTLSQTPFAGEGGAGSTAISNSNPSAGGSIEQSTNFSGSQAPKELIASSSSGFNLTASQIQEVDEARVIIAYPSGFYAVSGKGKNKHTFIRYRFQIAIKKIGSGSFETPITLSPSSHTVHSGLYTNATTFSESFDLNQYRPFADFKIIIDRVDSHENPGFDGVGETFHDWQNVTSASVSSVTCIIKDIITHPYSAMAKTTFSTKQFQGMPSRTYHLRGLKVQVPSNYVTREEAANGVANYNRDVSTGAITNTYQDWDGAFQLEKVYTNNPAWVFYDVLTNNRYGLGDFLKATDIDKYALFKIARYCDELVDDGKGGTEPRFTANLYFTKQTDAFKVLKDMATIFRGMLYFIDGQVFPVMDSPAGPVYNFSKSNVIEGKFSYETTGSKTRVNQVIVTWVNPDANYKAEPLIVEDKQDIVKQNRVITENAVAMGAITEGQALRYGRWKLWTAANQREIVNFSTALNASFLIPGDIINIQDVDRNTLRYSGRVSNTGTRNTTTIPIDSSVTINGTSSYELSIIFVTPGAFATSDVTINGVTYEAGQLIPQAFIDSNGDGTYTLQNIDSKVDAANAKATSDGTEALILNFGDTTRVEKRTLTNSAGATTSLTVSSAFTSTPDVEAIWGLTEVNSGGDTLAASPKQYKILSMSEKESNIFQISAVEFYNEKFDSVDGDFDTYVADTVYPAVLPTDTVPPVQSVFATNQMTNIALGEVLELHWIPPVQVGDVPGVYEHLAGFEISHPFIDRENHIRIMDPETTFYGFKDLPVGTHKIAVKVINVLDNLSEPEIITVTVSDKFDEPIPRTQKGVPYTGDVNAGMQMSNAGSFSFKNSTYTFKHPSTRGKDTVGTSNSLSHSQDCSGMVATTDTSTNNDAGEFRTDHYYLLLDNSETNDKIKLLRYHKPNGIGTPYFYDSGNGSSTTRFGSALSGTFTKAAKASKVTGSGTNFTAQIQQGDVLKLGTEEIEVSAVESNTVLYLAKATDTAHSGVQGFIPNIRIDYINDCIIARAYKDSSDNSFNFVPYAKTDGEVKNAPNVLADGTVDTAQIADDAISNAKIAANAVTDTEINVSNLSDISANLGTITGGTLSGVTISGGSADINATITVKDNGTTEAASAGTLNFSTKLDVAASGSTATITHADVSVSNSTPTESISGGTFDAVSSVTRDSQGHVTGVATKTFTLPATQSVNNSTITFTPTAPISISESEPRSFGTNSASDVDITIIHDNITRSNTTTNTTPSHGASVTLVESITSDSQGHITGVTTRNTTLPDRGAVNNVQVGIIAGTDLVTGGNFTTNQSSASNITINHESISTGSTSATASPSFAGTFTAISDLTMSRGHVTSIETKTVTLPSSPTQENFTTTLKNKLDGIEAGATADQTSEEIQDIVGAMVSGNTESGITVTYQDSDGTIDFSVASQTDENFTSADHSKLDGIEAGATADQTAAEIRALVESASDSNVFTDADHSKLNAIEASATADQTAAEIRTLVENASDSNVFTDADHTKLNAIEAGAEVNQTTEQIQDIVGAMVSSNTESGITVTYQDGDGTIDFSVASQTDENFTTADHSKLDGIEAGATADQTAAEIRALVESATDSNVFTDADHTKLNAIDSGAKADQTITISQTGGDNNNPAITLTNTDTTTDSVTVTGGTNLSVTRNSDDQLTINHDTFSHTSPAGPDNLPGGTPIIDSTNGKVRVLGNISHSNGHITGHTTAVLDFTGAVELDSSGSLDVKANSITANEIAANTITATQIASDTITASEIAADTITATEISGANANFNTLVANLATITDLTSTNINTEFLKADNILSRDIRVGPSQSGAALINGSTLTGSGAHLNSDGDFFVGVHNGARIFFDQDQATLTVRGTLNADDLVSGSLTSTNHSGTGDGSGFSTAGTKINLSNGSISAKNFRIDSSGNAVFDGSIDASSATITNINASSINTGSLTSTNHSGTGDGSGFSTAGTKINLSNGSISAKNFRIDSSGNAVFDGSIDASSATITNINASSINTGALNASLMTTGTLNASNITVTNLDANSINNMTLTTGTNGQLSIGTSISAGNQSVLLGPGSGGTGLGNTSIGKFAGGFTTGTDNVAIGQDAGMHVTSGSHNINIGSHTGRAPGGQSANKTGDGNIGIGACSASEAFNNPSAFQTYSALTSGDNNVSIGRGSGAAITTASNNLFLGTGAGQSVTTGGGNICIKSSGGTTGTGNVFIRGGGDMTTGSNNIIIGSFSGNAGGLDIRTSDSNIVFGNGSNVRLYINSSGVIQFNQAYSFPTADGSANQVLQTDGSGALTFATITDTNTQNQYAISCVDGDNSDEEKIRLSGSGHNGNTTDDIVLEAGTGLSIARSGDKITFANTVSAVDLSDISTAVKIERDMSSNIGIELKQVGLANANMIAFKSANNATLGGIVSSTLTTSTNYGTSSDYRLKTDIQDMSSATARLLALKPRNFKWIAGDTRSDGFIAHEVADVVPEAVIGEKDGTEIQLLDQSKLIPILVKTIQELEARIAVLEGS